MIYLRFLSKIESGAAGSGFGGISLLDGSTEKVFFGVPFDTTSWGTDEVNVSGGIRNSGVPANGTTRLLVGRMDFLPGRETIRFYVDPPLEGEPATPSIPAFTVNDFRFTGLRQASFGAIYATDELLLATTYAGVIGDLSLRIDEQPASTNVARNGTATFRIAASGLGPIRFQWFLNQTNLLAGATNATLTLTGVQSTNAGLYSVVVTNSSTSVTSAPALLNVVFPPTITQQPLTQGVLAGATAMFTVGVTGTPPFAFRWNREGAIYVPFGSGGPVLMITNVPLSFHSNRFTVFITNGVNPAAISSTVFLMVLADADGDGIADQWETDHGLNPAEPADALLDTDGDGVNNRDEYVAGTDPNDPADYLKIESLGVEGLTKLEFIAATNRTYTVQSKDALTDPVWTKVADVPASPTRHVASVTDPRNGTNRFYRLVSPVQP